MPEMGFLGYEVERFLYYGGLNSFEHDHTGQSREDTVISHKSIEMHSAHLDVDGLNNNGVDAAIAFAIKSRVVVNGNGHNTTPILPTCMSEI